MKSESVADASVVLAVLNDEPGMDSLILSTDELLLSAVNAAEVQSVLVRSGIDKASAWAAVNDVVDRVIPFDTRQAELAGNLIVHTKALGLSLGDRACLALGLSRNLQVLTTDRAWGRLKAGVSARVLR